MTEAGGQNIEIAHRLNEPHESEGCRGDESQTPEIINRPAACLSGLQAHDIPVGATMHKEQSACAVIVMSLRSIARQATVLACILMAAFHQRQHSRKGNGCQDSSASMQV